MTLYSPKLEELSAPKFCIRNAFMAIMTHAKFDFNQFMLTLIFGVRASDSPSPPPPPPPPPGNGKRLKRLGLIGLMEICLLPSVSSCLKSLLSRVSLLSQNSLEDAELLVRVENQKCSRGFNSKEL